MYPGDEGLWGPWTPRVTKGPPKKERKRKGIEERKEKRGRERGKINGQKIDKIGKST